MSKHLIDMAGLAVVAAVALPAAHPRFPPVYPAQNEVTVDHLGRCRCRCVTV